MGPILRSRRRYAAPVHRALGAGAIDLASDPSEVMDEVGLFSVPKKSRRQRLVVGARPANFWFGDPADVHLATGAAPAAIELPDGASLWAASADIADAFYNMELPHARRPYFALPPIDALAGGAHLEHVDTFASLSLDRDTTEQMKNDMVATLRESGLPVHEEESAALHAQLLGWVIDGERGSVSPTPRRVRRLILAARAPLDMPTVSAQQARRPLLSIFSAVYRFIAKAGEAPRQWWPSARRELARATGVAPLALADLRAEWPGRVMPADASEWGRGVRERELDASIVQKLGRFQERWRFRGLNAKAPREQLALPLEPSESLIDAESPSRPNDLGSSQGPAEPFDIVKIRQRYPAASAAAGGPHFGEADTTVDDLLAQWMDQQYAEGWNPERGAHVLAALKFMMPQFARGRLIDVGQTRAAIYVLVTFAGYLRPPEALRALGLHLIPPTPGGACESCSLVLHPRELAMPSKTQVCDEAIPFDAPFYGFLPAALRWLKASTHTSAPLFPFTLVQVSAFFKQAAVDAGLEVLTPQLRQLRHSGPSVELALKLRALASAKLRGRWRSDASVARYLEPGRVNEQMQRLAPRKLLGPRRRHFLAHPVIVEAFPGEGILAAALRREGALVIEWDIAWEPDWDLAVPGVARVLRGRLDAGLIWDMHFGAPRQTWTRISGAGPLRSPGEAGPWPSRLRSDTEIWGLAAVAHPVDRVQIDMANKLVVVGKVARASSRFGVVEKMATSPEAEPPVASPGDDRIEQLGFEIDDDSGKAHYVIVFPFEDNGDSPPVNPLDTWKGIFVGAASSSPPGITPFVMWHNVPGASWTADEWRAFLQSVDEQAAAPEVVTEVVTFLMAVSPAIPSSCALEGITESELIAADGAPTGIASRGLLRRALRTAECVAQAKRQTAAGANAAPQAAAGAAGGAAGPPPGGSALALASQWQPPAAPTVDVRDLLTKAKLEKLPFHMQPEQAVFESLNKDTMAARAQERKPFAYVDLTSKEVLPLWLPIESIGGKLALAGENELLNAESSTATLSQLQNMICHHDLIMQLAESERAAGSPPLLAVIYDEMARKAWSSRAARKDPEFVLDDLVQVQDKPVLTAARGRLASVLRTAGIQDSDSARPRADAATEREPILAKQQAAIDALTKRANDASKQTAQQQEAFRQGAFRNSGGPESAGQPGPKRPAGGAMQTPRQIKKQKFFERVQNYKREQQQALPLDELVGAIPIWNREVLSHLKDLPCSQDVGPDVDKDVALGAMPPPVRLTPFHVDNFLLMRRAPVREQRPSGWETRIADHGTECGLNGHTLLSDTLSHDTVDVLVEIELQLMRAVRSVTPVAVGRLAVAAAPAVSPPRDAIGTGPPGAQAEALTKIRDSLVEAFVEGDPLHRIPGLLKRLKGLPLMPEELLQKGLGVLLNDSDFKRRLDVSSLTIVNVLLEGWRSQARSCRSGSLRGRVHQPFAGLAGSRFQQAVLDLESWFVQLDGLGAAEVPVADRQKYRKTAILLSLLRVVSRQHLDGVDPEDIARSGRDPFERGLLRRAAMEASAKGRQKRARIERATPVPTSCLPDSTVSSRSSVCPPFSATCASADAVVSRLSEQHVNAVEKEVQAFGGQIGLAALGSSQPRAIITQLGAASVRSQGVTTDVLRARGQIMRAETNRRSLTSGASALRAWHVFAVSVLKYDSEDTLPPKCEDHVLLFLAIFQNAGTARNYLHFLHWACVEQGVDVSWHGPRAVQQVKGLAKMQIRLNGEQRPKPKLRRSLVEQLCALSASLGDESFAVSMLLAWEFLLRVQSECVCLQVGSAGSVLTLPAGRHSSVLFDEANVLHMRLRRWAAWLGVSTYPRLPKAAYPR
ncbi:unnamed protein product [Prorocentrum cordatum]|uniref:Uncharacterized protein n=1 Tax=Prorocentrum cordatum TaxID=2364126 RepID=A0ABN9QLZ5_9DINO|nr:unnamed protein product [Polarella glacialis]